MFNSFLFSVILIKWTLATKSRYNLQSATNSLCAADIIELQNGQSFCFLSRHKVHEQVESGKKLLIFLLKNFITYFWTLIPWKSCSYCTCHRFWRHKRTQKWLLSDQNLIKPSFLPRVASSRWLNEKNDIPAWCVPALSQSPALLFCKETSGSDFIKKEEMSM